MTVLSVVIVNWNTRTLLNDLLTSLFQHPPEVEFEVIVVDNASTDDSCEMIDLKFPQVELLVNSSNLGFAKAVNRGIRESHGKYVLLLNTDLVVIERSIDAQIAFMEQNPNAAFCGGMLLDENGVPNATYGRFPRARVLLAEVLPARIAAGSRIVVDPATGQSEESIVDIISGADMMARRTAFEDIGLFDEQFFMYFEDADWCYRAKQLGWDVWFVPAVCYYHVGIASAVSWSSFKKQWLTSLGLLIRKHHHGVQLVTCWMLWQLLRTKHTLSLILMHVEQQFRREKSN